MNQQKNRKKCRRKKEFIPDKKGVFLTRVETIVVSTSRVLTEKERKKLEKKIWIQFKAEYENFFKIRERERYETTLKYDAIFILREFYI
jgi:hypothetical protein